MKVIKPPGPISHDCPSLFLAGSIEMGAAEDWQWIVQNALADTNLTIYSPRRDVWDSSQKQDINNRYFREQVEWELMAMECATMIALYLSPGTKSPISLLELGLWAQPFYKGRSPKKLVVCCPSGFWRKGNVDIVCHRYSIPEVQSLGGLITYIRRELGL